ncbi:hypothetical protein E1B28_006986 [Marasmius oreades]|uniref:Uncharacterized protein n=1 Tax=Marasmius oreades TaxID=181124 RepID=A0A9P7UVG4_9AGAR|nr:uncharacterized protein E1B28_006986 [Marasmius oreades]KAG7093304.1 hypothetical protein E1B28_006986 [Marasmius oreades]
MRSIFQKLDFASRPPPASSSGDAFYMLFTGVEIGSCANLELLKTISRQIQRNSGARQLQFRCWHSFRWRVYLPGGQATRSTLFSRSWKTELCSTISNTSRTYYRVSRRSCRPLGVRAEKRNQAALLIRTSRSTSHHFTLCRIEHEEGTTPVFICL